MRNLTRRVIKRKNKGNSGAEEFHEWNEKCKRKQPSSRTDQTENKVCKLENESFEITQPVRGKKRKIILERVKKSKWSMRYQERTNF